MNVRNKIRNGWLGWGVCDLLAVGLAYFITLYLRFLSETGVRVFGWAKRLLGEGRHGYIGVSHLEYFLDFAPLILPVLAFILIVLYGINDLYDQHRFLRVHSPAWKILKANGMLFLFGTMVLYMNRAFASPRSLLPVFAAVNVVTCLGLRNAVQFVLNLLNERYGIGRVRVVLLGNSAAADSIAELIEEFHPKGLYLARRLPGTGWNFSSFESREKLKREIGDHDADMLIVGDASLDIDDIMRLLELTTELDLAVKILTRELDVLPTKAGLTTDTINGVPLIHFDPPSLSAKDGMVRRGLSFLLAATGVILSSPVMAIAALLIKCEDGGPVFFLQERIGVDRRSFKIIKFRTMQVDAERMQSDLEALNEHRSGLFKIRHDPRITRIGRILRRFSIDELPQLFNVLKGDMRIVGPRPLPRRDFDQYYEDWHYSRHLGKPGLTCLWQISGRSEIDFHNMCILDLYYLRNRNWALDLRIVLKTGWVVLFGRGAY